ncbi:MAG: hypothetical protein GX957_14540 [Clostridiaceae bacterium]|nr:hypothetical protein [Clostridiaceae bacterium]
MKRLIVKVNDKTKVNQMRNFCTITYISKFLNVIGVEIEESEIQKLQEDKNVISFRESEEGKFQPDVIGCY